MPYHSNKFLPDNPSPLNDNNKSSFHQSKIRYPKFTTDNTEEYDETHDSESSSVFSRSGSIASVTEDSTQKSPSHQKLKIDTDLPLRSRNNITTDNLVPTHFDDEFNYNNMIDEDIQSPDNSFMTQNLDLTNFPLFKKAPKSFYNKIISHLKLLTYHPQSFIIKKGDESKSMYWILKGTVYITSSDGESIYNELNAGEFFGEIGILFNRPRTANVIAKTRVLVGVLTSKDFNVVLKYFPLMERRIRDEAQERLAMLDKKSKQVVVAAGNVTSTTTDTLPPKRLVSANDMVPKLVPSVPHAMPRDKLDATISINQFIKNLPVFQNLPSNIIHRLCLGVEPLTFEPFQYIFYENDTGSDIYFIINGHVEVIKSGLKSADKPIARLSAGNYFGEMSFLTWLFDKPDFKRSASIRSITSVELVVIRSNLLKDLCKEYPFLIDHMRFTSEFRNHENDNNEFKVSNALKSEDRHEFGNFDFKFDFKPFHSRSVSPVTSLEDKEKDKMKEMKDTDKETKAKLSLQGPKPISIRPKRPLSKRSISLNLTPTLNPSVSINQFQPTMPDLEYIPVNKRLKISNSNLRRRSSILSHTSPLTDNILLRIFEFLDLKTLMKLRLINRRWRQL